MKICVHCERYVKHQEAACPFCSATTFVNEAASPPGGRRSRAQAFSARAALATATIGAMASCAGESETIWEGTGGAATSGGALITATGGTLLASGGTTPGTGGHAPGGAMELGGQGSELGGESGDGGSEILIYGGPFPDMIRARV